ncbi:hypothetical protein [Cereibacter johrii]|uniref:Lipoprotein n=1 Tax=Cereibacter johrii TaxID=445629 RepID=A0ABX5JGM4_9RHOB|nr:hypothetical protein [Cereibacter johrii]MEA5162431.1 hypothetical protein [Cereibacter johrii]PTM81912.1 hypothetical protein C8J29_101859 [Cereibacter johrii]RDS96413.1 hypothetical protein DWF04_10590 [Cereibacter sphaeroides f. sp. denitrificans]
MIRFTAVLPLAGLLLLAACGSNDTERAATGALGGAVVAGPPGALVGGAAGTLVD